MPKETKIATPNLQSLVERRAGGDEDEVRRFFDIKRKPGNAWLATLRPGIDACQRVLGPYITEQVSGDANEGDVSIHEEREKLCQEIFGHGGMTDIVFLKKLSHSIKSNSHIRIDFTTSETGKKLAISKPDDALPEKEAPEKAAFFGSAEASTEESQGADLEAIMKHMLPRVRLNPDEPKGVKEVLQAVAEGRWTRKVAMLVPMGKMISPHVVYSLLAHVRKQPWMGFHYETEVIIQRARNLLVQKFLASESEWAWFVDDDTIPPFKDPGFFYADDRLRADPTFLKPEHVDLMALERLMKAEKTLIGGVYQQRKAGGKMVIQPALHPRDPADNEVTAELQRHGPINRVMQVGYVGTGCALIHRKVFLDIMDTFPELKSEHPGEPFDFFGHDMSKEGEDIYFCKMAAKAGHASFLDLGLWCAHIGNFAFFPERKLN